MKRRLFPLLAATLILAHSGTVLAGTLIKAKETDLIEGGVGESTILAEGDNLKVETSKNGKRMVLLYQKSADRISLLDPDAKTVRQISIKEMEQALNTASQAMQQMERQIAALPPEQQAMVRDMLKKQKIPGVSDGGAGAAGDKPKQEALTYTQKATGETVGAWSCTRYEGKQGTTLKREIWTAPQDAIALRPEDWKAITSLGDTFSKMGREFGQGANAVGFTPPSIEDAKNLGLDGVPVKVLSYGEGRASHQWELTEVKQETFSAETFSIPTDYVKSEIKIPKISPQ